MSALTAEEVARIERHRLINDAFAASLLADLSAREETQRTIDALFEEHQEKKHAVEE